MDGQGKNASAFDGTVTGVTIEYLKIQNFTPAGSQGAVNHDSARGWRISHDTIDHNSPGAGVMMGTRDVVSYDCLTKNGEYGLSAYVAPTSREASALTHGPLDLTLSDNEISYNDTCNFEQVSPDPAPHRLVPDNCAGGGEFNGCGCSGGGKFWQVDNAVVAGNYVHDNFAVGLWADTNNNGFIFRGNYIDRNYSSGIMYEISYNARIRNNTFISNAVGAGPTNGGFPTGAIYLSESGGDARVPNSARIRTISITGNTFTNNWSGVVLWESSDRFCGSPDNSSTGVCTLVAPKIANIKTCVAANLAHAKPAGRPDYYALCRWKTQNVVVSDNAFHMRDSAVARCRRVSNSCGENAVFSQYGTSPSWSPYRGNAIPLAITRAQHNEFDHNTYTGRWNYMYFNQSTTLNFRQWRKRSQD